MKIRKILFYSLSLLIIISASFVLGYYTKSQYVFLNPSETNFELIAEAYQLITNNFVSAEDISEDVIIHGAIAGMVSALGDPYSNFFNIEDTKIFLDDTEGKFEGVGMEVGIRDDDFKVISPLKGTPAYNAGILSGDIVLRIDDVDTRDVSLEDGVALIRGEKGTEVVLMILRDGWSEPREFKIIRDVISVASAEWELLDGDIAHINLYHFYRNADYDFKNIALDIINSPAKAIVLDMRGNSGGYLNVSREIAEWFLEKGDVFVIEDSPSGQRIEEIRSNGRLYQYPLIVLIDTGSASASEIVAGALRDNRGIQLIGQTSFGKGSIQKLEYLSDGSSIKITIARWLTPNGDLVSEKGLTPDIEVDFDVEEYKKGNDIQLNKALEVIQRMI